MSVGARDSRKSQKSLLHEMEKCRQKCAEIRAGPRRTICPAPWQQLLLQIGFRGSLARSVFIKLDQVRIASCWQEAPQFQVWVPGPRLRLRWTRPLSEVLC